MSAAHASPETEKAGLFEFLGYKREALINTLQGLSDAEARMTPTASSLSLLSLVKHSAIWERRWFQVIVAGRRFPGEWPEMRSGDDNDDDNENDRDRDREDATFRLDDEDTVETVVRRLPGTDRCLERDLGHLRSRLALCVAGDGPTGLALGRVAHARGDRPSRRPRRHHP